MRESIEMPRKIFYIIVGLCSAIIMLTSIDILLRTKDTNLFNMWLQNTNFTKDFLNQSEELLFSEYVQMNISIFITRVITPIGLAIHTYFTLVKLRVNKLYIILWLLIMSGAFIMTSLGEHFYSIFFIISVILHIGLVCIMIYLWKSIHNIRSI